MTCKRRKRRARGKRLEIKREAAKTWAKLSTPHNPQPKMRGLSSFQTFGDLIKDQLWTIPLTPLMVTSKPRTDAQQVISNASDGIHPWQWQHIDKRRQRRNERNSSTNK